MVHFQTKNPNMGNFWRALDWKMFVYFMANWDILWLFGNLKNVFQPIGLVYFLLHITITITITN
jgi:hypothetical protein